MDRQAVSRIILFASILTLVVLAALGDASRVLVLVVAVPFGFLAGAVFLLSVPFAAVRKAEGARLGMRRLLDVAEHAGPLAWIDLMILWSTAGIAFLGFATGTTLYRSVLIIAAVVGLVAALRDLYLSEEPDNEQEEWQEHPNQG